MAQIDPFEQNFEQYESWFEKHQDLYQAELKAMGKLLPPFHNGIEIGVGSGRFAAPLGIKKGVEPSGTMAQKARERGIEITKGFAEDLPLESGSFDLVMMVTSICFVDDALKSLQEAYRILDPNGFVLLGFVDATSRLGELYQQNRKTSRFYAQATFYSTDQMVNLCQQAGFGDFAFVQTLLGDDPKRPRLDITDGYGQGAFVVLRAKK